MGKRARYPAQLKTRVVECAERRKAAGESFAKVSAALGLSRSTLDFWKDDVSKGRSKPNLRRVVVAEPSGATQRSYAVESSNGLRVTGLSLDEVRALLGANS